MGAGSHGHLNGQQCLVGGPLPALQPLYFSRGQESFPLWPSRSRVCSGSLMPPWPVQAQPGTQIFLSHVTHSSSYFLTCPCLPSHLGRPFQGPKMNVSLLSLMAASAQPPGPFHKPSPQPPCLGGPAAGNRYVEHQEGATVGTRLAPDEGAKETHLTSRPPEILQWSLGVLGRPCTALHRPRCHFSGL